MKRILLLVLLLSVGIGLFYWYEYRPSKIRAQCEPIASDAKKKYSDKRNGCDAEAAKSRVEYAASMFVYAKKQPRLYEGFWYEVDKKEKEIYDYTYKSCLSTWDIMDKTEKDVYESAYKSCLRANGIEK